MTSFDFILLELSAILLLVLIFMIIRMKNKMQIHYVFLGNLVAMFVWDISHVLNIYAQALLNYYNMLFINMSYIGVSFIPVTLLFTGLTFAKSSLKLTKKHYALFAVPLLTCLIVFTNDLHKLFYKNYSFYNNDVVYGPYFLFHSLFSYVCILVGLYYLVFFSIKNSGFFSKQSGLIIIGTSIPLVINILYTLNLVKLSAYATPIAFSIAILFYILAILKFGFLNIIPIALQSVVDRISDAFVVINRDGIIIDFNKAFMTAFGEPFGIKRSDNLMDIADKYLLESDKTGFLDYLNQVREKSKPVIFEKHLEQGSFNKYFTIEITPIISNERYIGTIILFKDITQAKKDLETIKENQAILLEQERLASLGQLIGGIAHNLKTPIMSIAGGIEAVRDLVLEYRDSIEDQSVTVQDHKEIAVEMLSWLDKMKPYCTYMSDVITAVKGQAVQMNVSNSDRFTIDELVKRVDLLMKHELKKYHCLLNVISDVDMNTEIKGEVNNLVQVFDNIIINAIDAYEGKNGNIDFRIVRSGNNVEFTFRDYGRGIPEEVRERLFKEMVTTKGKNGTGLGMYMSYSTVKGRFGGNMSFTSKEGAGTTFLISIPCITYFGQEVN